MTVLLIFTVTVLPVSIAFYSEQQLNPEWLTINILVDFLFLTDVFVNFRTGVYAPDEQVMIMTYWYMGKSLYVYTCNLQLTIPVLRAGHPECPIHFVFVCLCFMGIVCWVWISFVSSLPL